MVVATPSDLHERGCAMAITVLLVPSAAGVRMLRTRGRRHLVAEWEGHLRRLGPGDTVPIEWRLTEELPADAGELAGAEGRPAWMPIVSEVVLEPGVRALTCRLRVPYDMAIFRGHFPSAPIVPGVMQVGWAVGLARTHGLARGSLAGIDAAKFRRLVRPGMRLVARVERGARPGQVSFRYECGDTVVATGRLQFGVERD